MEYYEAWKKTGAGRDRGVALHGLGLWGGWGVDVTCEGFSLGEKSSSPVLWER